MRVEFFNGSRVIGTWPEAERYPQKTDLVFVQGKCFEVIGLTWYGPCRISVCVRRASHD